MKQPPSTRGVPKTTRPFYFQENKSHKYKNKAPLRNERGFFSLSSYF